KVADTNVHRIASLIQRCADEVAKSNEASKAEGNATASIAEDNATASKANAAPIDPMSLKIGNLYNLAMDLDRLNREGTKPLKKYLDEIEAISSREEFIFSFCTLKHRNPFWGFSLSPDDKDSSMNILHITQGGLSLARDYYEDDQDAKKIFGAFRKMAISLLEYHGFKNATELADEVLAIEAGIAAKWYKLSETRIPEKNYHKMSIADISKQTSFDWDRYLKAYGYDETSEANLAQPEPIIYGCNLIMTLPLQSLKNFMIFHKVIACATNLDQKCYDIWFEFRKVVAGQIEPSPRWKFAKEVVNSILTPVVGQRYVAEYFSPEAKSEAYKMIKNIQQAFAERIKNAQWMSEKTKETALDKLNSLTIKVGYPNKYDDLSELEINPELSLLDNMNNIGKFFWRLRKEKYYNKPVDKDEWSMDPQDVNAYYDPSTNEICFPAAILQEPFFSPNADLAQNYGMIGTVIAHEMTHGFDDEGRKYDKEGNLNEWWDEADIKAFKIPTDKYIEYYNRLWVLRPTESDPAGLHPKGDQCIGENIADLGGVNISFDAFKKACETNPQEDVTFEGTTYTPEQRFFLSYALVWDTNAAEEFYRYLTNIDVHSVGYLRVNGPLPHIDAWYDAFGITPESPLYLAPSDRIKIW
ncbi:MAG: M13 family metallopeptidase, partial [Bacteroidales bacterium]|nr:M13 family metallopeptidase [Bacteroidales bacterium]